jgi:hypothetical protein
VNIVLDELERLGFTRELLIGTLTRFIGCRPLHHRCAWINTVKFMQKATRSRT